MTRKLLLISSSRVFGYGYLENAADNIREFLIRSNVSTVLFIPYASTKYDSYLKTVREAFTQLNLGTVRGIHEGENPINEINSAEAIFIGGGNTFLLLKTLYDLNLVEHIRKQVLQNGIPYMGSSAGTNVATISINTTNDMPIVQPPTFAALGLVPFNINPHYLDPMPNSRHMGETRSERIKEYFEMKTCHPVLAIREGSALLVEGTTAKLLGDQSALLFKKDKDPEDIPAGSDLSALLQTEKTEI